MYNLRYKIGEVSRLDWLRWFSQVGVPPEFPLSSPQAGGEGFASVSMQEVDGEAFEGVSIRHGSPHRVLELFVATGGAGAALQLVGWQRRGQQVAKVVVPHGGQLQVLQEGANTFSSGRIKNENMKILQCLTIQNKVSHLISTTIKKRKCLTAKFTSY